jgi:hypothetical protein
VDEVVPGRLEQPQGDRGGLELQAAVVELDRRAGVVEQLSMPWSSRSRGASWLASAPNIWKLTGNGRTFQLGRVLRRRRRIMPLTWPRKSDPLYIIIGSIAVAAAARLARAGAGVMTRNGTRSRGRSPR